MAGEVDRAVEELYALPPQDFTRARNLRAAALKTAGREADARAVRELRKPPLTLWATNHLARVEPERLAALVRAVDQLRQTQLRDRSAAAEALQRQRAELTALVGRAGEIMAEQGHPPTPATQRRISDTLLGAAADRHRADELRAGRLIQELTPPGFDAFAGAPTGPHLKLVHGGKHESEARRPSEDRLAALQAEREQRAAEREHRAQEVESERHRRAVELAEAAERAQREVRELEASIAESRRRLREAQRAAGRAATAARRAERKARR